MILKNFVVKDRVNLKIEFNGIDSYSQCVDKAHFENFSWPVDYTYNTRGFRDREWPESLDDLKNNVVWCIGDSFTAGIGSPVDHTWPRAIERQSGLTTINVSKDGASNDWILERAQELMSEINPKFIVIMWSFIHRRQEKTQEAFDPGQLKQLHSGRTTNHEDLEHFAGCLNQLRDRSGATVIHAMVPEAAPAHSIDHCRDLIAQQQHHIPMVQKIDLARDGFHFDRVTSEAVAQQVLLQIPG